MCGEATERRPPEQLGERERLIPELREAAAAVTAAAEKWAIVADDLHGTIERLNHVLDKIPFLRGT